MKSKFFSYFFYLIFFLFLTTKPIIAQKDFETSYFSIYQLNPNASTVNVEHQITIKNRLMNIYVSEYSIVISSNRLTEIKAWDNFGFLSPTFETGPNFTKILIKFKEKVVGKDKQNTLHLSYQTSDFVNLNGQILEIGIPSVLKKEELDDYQIQLSVPLIFGLPSYISPQPNREEKNNQNYVFYFLKDQLLKTEAITATFGEKQIFDFKLIYQLKNEEIFPIKTEISLPPDTAFQKVYYDFLSPLPLEVKVDNDDNWLAIYRLNPKEKIQIVATGSAEIFLKPQKHFPQRPLTENEFKNYLKAQKYWESNHPEVIKIAQELKTPEQIYNYVVKNLAYDYGRLKEESYERQGALKALTNKSSALCSEFSDLFIALSRAAGIPAREVAGFAYTNNPQLRPLSLNKDILHAWAEYYDVKQNLWLPVDPTWGKTTGGLDYFNKLDFNHFAFVKHGEESDYPPPAGTFNLNFEEKTVFVDFGQKKQHPQGVDFYWLSDEVALAGFPFKGKILLINSGSSALYQQKLTLNLPFSQEEIIIKTLPPKAKFQHSFEIKTTWWSKNNYQIQALFANQKSVTQITFLPFYEYFYQKLLNYLKLAKNFYFWLKWF